MRVAICLVFCAASFATVAGTGARHGVHITTGGGRVPASQARPVTFAPPAPPRRNTGMDLVRRYLYAQVILNLINSLKATTTAAPTDPPTVAPTPAPTPDPCPSWPSANGCKYQIFKETLVWTAAKAKCPTMCGSVLAHKNIRTAAQVTLLLTALQFPATGKAWVNLHDPDGQAGVAPPLWNSIESAAALGLLPADYDTTGGVASCGYLAVGLARNFKLDQCTSTSSTTPEYYICEVCPP